MQVRKSEAGFCRFGPVVSDSRAGERKGRTFPAERVQARVTILLVLERGLWGLFLPMHARVDLRLFQPTWTNGMVRCYKEAQQQETLDGILRPFKKPDMVLWRPEWERFLPSWVRI